MNTIYKKILIMLAGITMILGLLLVFTFREQNDFLEVTFLNVGQGDGILIETPSGHTILIDGGPDRSVLAEVGRSLPFYHHTIDLLVLTHGDADHVGGFVELTKRYGVGHVLYSGVDTSYGAYEAWREVTEGQGIDETIASQGKSFEFGDVLLEVLYPFEDVSSREVEDPNDYSVITKLTYGETEFLFTGDAPIEAEDRMLAVGIDVKADVLKVGHHGSKYSSSKEFIAAVDPEIAVIQSDIDNTFGHPHKVVLDNLEDAGVKTLRNDLDGRITLISDGESVSIK